MARPYHCTLCKDEAEFGGPLQAIDEGWVLTEMRGPTGNKYGVFCSKHDKAEISGALGEMLDIVVPAKAAKKK